MIRILVLLLLIGFQSGISKAQDTIVLSLDEVLFNVLRYHPVLKQAEFIELSAEGNLLMQKGAFDPVLSSVFNEKKLNDRNYYSQFGTELKIPTRIGVDVKTGFDRASGLYVNDYEETGVDGLYYAGLSVPLGRRLFTDERRTALKQAKLYQNQAIADRQAMTNDVLAELFSTYIQWSVAYEQVKVYLEAAKLAETRLSALRIQFKAQERSSPDTLEAFIQYQSRLVDMNAWSQEMVKAYFKLEANLWDEQGNPLFPALNAIVVPTAMSDLSNKLRPSFQVLSIDQIDTLQPALNSYGYQIEILEKEVALKKEFLKPQADLNYHLIQEPFYNGGSMISGISLNNYKFGVNFYMPLFLRKERGALNLARIKTEMKRQELIMKRREVWNKIQALSRQEVLLSEMLAQQDQMVQNYRRLLAIENMKFELGESTLFMINAREIKMIESQVKGLEVLGKLQMLWIEKRRLIGDVQI